MADIIEQFPIQVIGADRDEIDNRHRYLILQKGNTFGDKRRTMFRSVLVDGANKFDRGHEPLIPLVVVNANFILILGWQIGGQIKGGRHLVYPDDTPLTNLQLTLLNKMGVPAEKLGDSTGQFKELSELSSKTG